MRVPAGDIPVDGLSVPHSGDQTWTLTAKPATITEGAVARSDLASAVGLNADDLVDEGWWVDAGVDQFLTEVTSVQAVRRAAADPVAARRFILSPRGESMALVWAWTSPDTIEARFFFSQDAAMIEDPATGSAAANLGSLLALSLIHI